ncbi:MAG: type I secretion system permease/ATPase [Alphaproteobacteria bacterium]|nr:type I secretion system permease/ATPase [Alphaproteobacteria bacterium]
MTKTRTPVAPQLAEALRACRVAFVALFGFSFAINALMLVMPIYMMQVYDRVLTSHSMETLMLLTVIALGAMFVMAALEVVRSRLMVRLASWLDDKLGGPLLTGDIALSVHRSNSASAQGLRDLAVFRTFLTGPSVFALLDAPWVPLFLVVLFLLHPAIGWLSTIGAVVLFALALASEEVMREPTQRAGIAAREAQSHADLFVRNANVVDAMGMMPNLVRRWQAANEKSYQQQASASDLMGLIAAASKFLRMALQTVILATGAWLAAQHEASGGAIAGAGIIMGRALGPVDQLIGSWKGILVARDSYQRLKALLAAAPPRGVRTKLPVPKGLLTLENVVFIQPNHREPVIKGVSFEVPPGEMLAVIGASAAGKSTLAQLIIGNWRPFRGNIRIDGADLSTWDADQLGRYLGYLPQDVELFDGTVRDNIARLGDGPDEAVIDAAQRASVHEMILKMPEGYDTQIGDGGSSLSGGQRQRIALARALYGHPKLVVLDEPDASLDSGAENRLIQTLLGLKGKATVVLITHRLSLLNLADKVLMLRNGMVEAFGPRNEVVQRLTGVVVNAPRPVDAAPAQAPAPAAKPMGPVLVQGGRK